MADVSIDISALDRGGRALINGITQALRALRSEQSKQAEASRNQAAQSKAAAQGLSDQAQISKALIIDEQRRLRATQEASKQRIAAIRQERDEEVKAVQAMARGQNELAKGFQKMAAARLKAAETRQQERLGFSPNADRQLAAQAAARRAELATANANVARAAALGERQIAQARRLGQAEEQEAKTAVRTQRDVVKATQQRAAASAQAARQAESDARAQERAANRAATSFQRHSQATQSLNDRMSALRRTVLNLIFAYSGFRVIEKFIGAGLRFNQIIESSRLGIGALITAEADLFNQQGKQLTGTEALAAAQGLAADQLDKLRVAGIQTAATTEDLVTAFEEAVGAGVSVGLTLDQIRIFTVQIAQAASAIHLPMNQLQQETRSILQGTIDRNSRIAKALQLTNAQVNLAKEQGRLADLLNEKFKAFNLAGIESVKTFGALKSNLSDAFSVFAGRATEPLFRQIRDAGVSALSTIFDFRSADISQSFQGLVQGLQTIFNQIGGMLADAIRIAVEKAQDLSAWFAKNREEVKTTAGAIRTMVESFGNMVSSIVTVVTQVAGLGRGVNSVVGAARVLSAVMDSIAKNAGLIVSLLTSRALAAALIRIAAVFSGTALGETVGGPLGAAVGALIGLLISLGAGYKLVSGFQKEFQLETARATTALEDQTQSAADLFREISNLERQKNEAKKGSEELATIEGQLADKFEQVKNLGPEYANAIGDGNTQLKERKNALLEVIRTQVAQIAFQAAAAEIELNALRARREELLKQQQLEKGFQAGVLNFVLGDKTKEALEEVDRQLALSDAKTKNFRTSLINLNRALIDAFTAPAKIKRKPGDAGAGLGADTNDAVQRAQAELERVKAVNEARLNVIQAQFKNGAKNAIDVINAEKEAALAEMSAEQSLLEAQRNAAARRVIKGKVVPDQGAIDAANVKLDGLQARRTLLDAETNEKIETARKNHLEQLAKIEEDFARATGRRADAIRMEIERKHQDELESAIREFGPKSEEVIKIRFVIQQESIDEQAQAIEGEIRRLQEGAQREIATARLRILGPDAERGTGNAAQRQQLAAAVAAANAKAVADAVHLRGVLIDLRDAATDPLEQTFIQSLIDQIDQMKEKSKEIDLTMRRLKEGIGEGLVSGFEGFFNSIAEGTASVAQSFRNMVNAILQDIGRLVSRLIAEKIVFDFLHLGTAAASSGGQAGNLTQSSGRAAGGLARPPHGQLRGGIPGTDSIHIAAMPEEYFVKVPAVRYYGTEFMDAVNNMQLPRVNPRSFRPLAAGGGVLQPSTAVARQSTTQDLHAFLHFDRRGLIDVLNGPVGRDVVIGHAQKNPRAMRNVVQLGKR